MPRNYFGHFGLLVAPLVNPRPGRKCCGWSEDRHPGEQRLRPQPRSQHPWYCLSGQVEESNGGSTAAVCSFHPVAALQTAMGHGLDHDPSAPEARCSAALGPRREISSLESVAALQTAMGHGPDHDPSAPEARCFAGTPTPGSPRLVGLALIPIAVQITRSPNHPITRFF